MRAVVQRVRAARLDVEGTTLATIGLGLVAFVGAGQEDTDGDLSYVANKVAGLRVFEDEVGKMNRSVADVGGEVLVVSQFTVYGDVRRGKRPSFAHAMAPPEAKRAYDRFVALMRELGVRVATGQFQAHMRVLVDNDGPVTILIDSEKRF
ncbi:MAG: D-tyrosyl-tRNA(Tyr) deacylase [Deltaproteobacteria bacterium]|jgi:D-tyrosyl-tRNA(Tyr) deacylase|nr:D-tyrosyl-tRNA(Tyr) deacylase [Deltaproteobacteria bacterium]MBW2531862.1 D-tyrosyl-tRNA(Tyr) deacylase [Deltaproteobacteria bacterium]